MEKIFVYGSLMSNFWNHDKVLKNRVKKIQKGKIQGNLYHLPEGYPAVIEGEGAVYGEVCTIMQSKLLKSLDLLEGYIGEGEENLYERCLQEVTLEDGAKESCWVYLYVAKNYAKNRGVLVSDGNWKAFMERK